ncbi:MAG: hypothetical protein QF755_05155 [Candidatus Peribacteraceae bacterium]|jgi:hypothetical protein|nr:hypothetical protein [Candidatus Peribacteraceae bacterium]|tara:strand:- start:10810 stop:12714 length:1905 start_codon:yes stop_codon:yes gene_type:complete
MKRTFLISALITLVILPIVVITQAPAYVEGLDISLEEGEITLQWKEQPNMDIASYRIYYSFESILENDGLYDDVIETQSDENEHKFPPPDGYDELYFAVIGVNEAGEDIDKFVEEISIQIDDDGGLPDDDDMDDDDEDFLEDDDLDDDFDEDFSDDDDDLSEDDESFLEDDDFDDDLPVDDDDDLEDDDLVFEEDDDFADDDDFPEDDLLDEDDLPFGDDDLEDDDFADDDDLADDDDDLDDDFDEDFADDDDDLEDDLFVDEDLPDGDMEDDLMGGDEDLLPVDENFDVEAEDILMVQDEILSIPGSYQPYVNEIVNIPTTVQAAQPPAPTQPLLPPPPSLPASVSLLSAEAISPTQVQLLFSAAILVEPTRAPEAFSIVDSSGNPLHILQLAIQDEQATINTQEQVAGTVYELRVSEPAYSPQGIPLDQIARRAFFNGHLQGRGRTQVAGTVQVVAQEPFQGISNLKLEQTPEGNGVFIIKASWDVIGSQIDLAHYVVNQSRDGGMTFGESQNLQANINGIEIPSVEPGPFGLMLSYVKKDGQAFMGKFQSINVGGVGISSMPSMAPIAQPGTQQPTPPPVAATVQAAQPLAHQPSALNNTGPGAFAAAVIVFGGVAGWMASRKRKMAGELV